MATQADLKSRRAATQNNTAANGGRFGAILVDGGSTLYPPTTETERQNGSTLYRKQFIVLESTDAFYLTNNRIFVNGGTPGDDKVTILAVGNNAASAANIDSTEAQITGTERMYGTGTLSANVSVGATSFVVDIESAADASMFQAGDEIILNSREDFAEDTDSYEFLIIDTVSNTGAAVTITTTTATQNPFSTGDVVSSCMKVPEAKAKLTDSVVTSVSGTFNPDAATLTNVNAWPQVITLTFTTSTAFNAAADTSGAIGSGSILSTFSPTNPNTGGAWFTIPPSSFGGTFIPGEVISFRVQPCGIAVWNKRVVPAGATATAQNFTKLAFSGDLTSD